MFAALVFMAAPMTLSLGQIPDIGKRVLPDFSLTPPVATVIFVLGCLAGYRYRHVWKTEGPRWQLWLFGAIAAASLLTLGFVPMAMPG